jgi:hypothetical protein
MLDTAAGRRVATVLRVGREVRGGESARTLGTVHEFRRILRS